MQDPRIFFLFILFVHLPFYFILLKFIFYPVFHRVSASDVGKKKKVGKQRSRGKIRIEEIEERNIRIRRGNQKEPRRREKSQTQSKSLIYIIHCPQEIEIT